MPDPTFLTDSPPTEKQVRIAERVVVAYANAAEDSPSRPIDPTIFERAIRAGLTKEEAVVLAGFRSLDPEHHDAIEASNRYLTEHPDATERLLTLLKHRRAEILDALTPEKAQRESYRNLTVALDVVTKQIRLYEGQSTENVLLGNIKESKELAELDDDAISRLLAEKVDAVRRLVE